MNSRVGTGPNDRLADYFAIIGAGPVLIPVDVGTSAASTVAGGGWSSGPDADAAVHPLSRTYRTTVRQRFPMLDYEAPPFPTGVGLFCFPDGLTLRDTAATGHPLPTYFTFVATGGTGRRLYGHCVIIHEPLTDEQAASFEALMLAQSAALAAAEATATEADGGAAGGAAAVAHSARGPATVNVKKVHAPLCLCLLTQWNFPDFRIFITKLYQLSLSTNTVPIERVLCTFLTEVPLPPAGKVQVEFQIADATLTFARPPPNNRISAMSIPFHEVFECLDLENVLLVLTCVVTERQVLFVSSQLSLLTCAAEVFTSLMYPFSWPHVYIPVLPLALVQVLQAPMPFIVGLSSTSYSRVSVPPNVVQVFLDENRVVTPHPPEPPIPEIPTKQYKKLLTALQSCANAFATRGELWRETVLPMADFAFKNAVRPSEVGMYPEETHGRIDWDETRAAVFRMFLSLLANYRTHLIFPTNKDLFMSSKRFDTAAFKKEHPEAAGPFLDDLLVTQCFQNFVDERIQPEPDDVDVIFFDESLDVKLHRSLLKKFSSLDTPFLSSTEYAIKKTVVALAPSTVGIPEGAVYTYTRFPMFQPDLFTEPRPVPPLADTNASIGRHKFRNMAANSIDVALGVGPNVFACWFLTYTSTLGVHVTDATGAAGSSSFDALLAAFSADDGDSEHKAAPMAAEPSALSKQASAASLLHAADCGWGIEAFIAEAKAARGLTSPSSVVSDATLDSHVTVIHGDGDHAAVPASGAAGSAGTATEASEPAASAGGTATATATATAAPPPPPPRPGRGRRASRVGAEAFELQAALSVARAEEHVKLDLAFAVLRRMQREKTSPQEIVFRSLIDACGRCGNAEKAMLVLREMSAAGIPPDSTVYSCLVRAFSMDATATSSLPMITIDWNQFRERPDSGDANGDRSALSRAIAAFKRPSSDRSGAATPDHKSPQTASVASPAPHAERKGSMISWIKGKMRNDTAKPATSEDASRAGSSRDSNGSTKEMESELDGSKAPPGFGILGTIFPMLSFDTNRETCPMCRTRLSDQDIQNGWLRDPNDYTTACPNIDCSGVGENGAAIRFVARFEVFSAAPYWIGSRGPRESLFCEYLPPWVLLKDLTAAMDLHGERMVCSTAFRHRSPTIFWNLVLYFDRYRLPMDFLVPTTVMQALAMKQHMTVPELRKKMSGVSVASE